jgi:hypothetical protein
MDAYLAVIASGAKQSTLAFSLPHGLLRCARNDDLKKLLAPSLFELESEGAGLGG